MGPSRPGDGVHAAESDPRGVDAGQARCSRDHADRPAPARRCEILCGDLDGDGDVDLEDRTLLVDRFGLREGDAGWLHTADLDGDGEVTLIDYRCWLDALHAYQTPPPVAAEGAPAAAAEPGALLCGVVGLEPLALVLVVLLRRSRTRCPAARRESRQPRDTHGSDIMKDSGSPARARRRPALWLALVVLLALPGHASAQVVELNPVQLTGTIRIGDYVITSMNLNATSSAGTSSFSLVLPPDTVEASYSTIVQVPAGGSATYFLTAQGGLRTADGSQGFTFGFRSPMGVRVEDGVPATLDLILDPPSLVRATVTALPGELLDRVFLSAQRWDTGGFAVFSTSLDASPGGVGALTVDLPVGPNVLLRCFGTALMTNGRFGGLEPFQLVTVPDGGVGTCEFTPAEPPELGGIRGIIDFAGDVPVDQYRLFADRNGSGAEPDPITLLPPFVGPGNRAEYEFTEVEGGAFYDVNALVELNDGIHLLSVQLADRAGVSEGTTTVIGGGEICQANLDARFVFGGLTQPEEWTFRDTSHSATRIGEAGGVARVLADPLSGPVRFILWNGRWRQNLSFTIVRDRFEPGGFTNTTTAGGGFHFSQTVDVACGETVSSPDRVLDTGRVEVRFRVADGRFLQSPVIRAFCTLDDEQTGDEIYSYETLSSSAAGNTSVAVGVVPVEAPAGVCDFVATARVSGVNVSFGRLNDVAIVPGVEVVVGLGGPQVEITSPMSGARVDLVEILVTGTATDDVGIAGVVVNGMAAELSPTGNPFDPVEVAFSALVPLVPGENRIAAVASDGDGNETEASVDIENTPPPPDQEPEITITSPLPGDSIESDEVLVEGTASDDGLVVSVVVDGIEASLVSTGNPEDPSEVRFTVWVPLLPGANQITAIATDDGGNQSEAGVEVESVEPPALPCDANGDGLVDYGDIAEIFAARGTPASGPDDPRDANGDGLITINDGRICVLQCTNPGCTP